LKFFYLLGPSANTERRLEEEGGLGSSVTGRLVSIENLEIGGAEVRNDEIELTAKFQASTFRQEAPAAAPGKPGAADKKGGVKAAKEAREKAVESSAGAGDEGAKRLTNPGTPVSPK
jgi:hypothetical protein